MKRRTVLKIVALGAIVPAEWGSVGANQALAWSPKDYQLRFFTKDENLLVDKLTEMIIPADEHSPGAYAAKVSLFADLMVATSSDAVKTEWRNGLQLMQEEAARSSLEAALAKAAGHERAPQTDLERFFKTLKEMTVNGYYTSAIGIHQDLQYQGNTYLASFPGCTMPNIAKED
ncbi:MAG TPA: gluconate 2-dehydrogenase subunit 3 family protein [Terriglobia bacterium]|nr:gluconate 2-dehydrogenase subunit 3 family protein [Terriglobia bacterium]